MIALLRHKLTAKRKISPIKNTMTIGQIFLLAFKVCHNNWTKINKKKVIICPSIDV